ncbi:MAG: DUF1294 domain-containing protein [Clostridia bacterium]|nr:DUF1294 domain-containing protein [Clostridia bacterium]
MMLAAWTAANLVCFTLMGIDKRRAVRGRRRIRERTLFLSAALFGALGGVIGMQVFRHKTKHRSFCIGFPALLTVQTALILIICGLRR